MTDSHGMRSNLPTAALKFSAYGLFNLLNAVAWFVFTLFSQEMGRFLSSSFLRKYLDFYWAQSCCCGSSGNTFTFKIGFCPLISNSGEFSPDVVILFAVILQVFLLFVVKPIFKVIFKTDLSYLLSLVFVSLSLIFVHVLFFCFDLLFLFVFWFMLSSRIYLLPY